MRWAGVDVVVGVKFARNGEVGEDAECGVVLVRDGMAAR